MSDPAETLDPAEVAALLGPPPSELEATATVAPPSGLRRVAAQAARRLGRALARCSGTPVDVQVAWVARTDPRELAAALPDPMCAILWRRAGAMVSPAAGRDGVTSVCELSPALAHHLLERMLGAVSPTPARGDWRPSPAEEDALRVVGTELAHALADVLGSPVTVHDIETAPRMLAEIAAPATACCFEVLGPGFTALVHLLWPA